MPEWTAQELCAPCAGGNPRLEAFFEVVYEAPGITLLGRRQNRDLRLICPNGHDVTHQVRSLPLPPGAPQGAKARVIRAARV